MLGCEDVDGFDAVAKGEKVEPVSVVGEYRWIK